MRRVTSAVGTFETSSDVRIAVANGGKPDMARTVQFGRDWTHFGPAGI
jgi:hypothetical protein